MASGAATSSSKIGSNIGRYVFSKFREKRQWILENKVNLGIVGGIVAATKICWDALHRVPPGHVAIVVGTRDGKVGDHVA